MVKAGKTGEEDISNSFLVLLFLTTLVFSNKTKASDSTHNQIPVIEQYVDG
ncbi:hypothetical protein Tmel_1115 [Thermosipho melanesiensis BI429]|uniref:Uncharacterized protein n=1 Tax=Thermosipho melanesiensis (strain DSM 12029 / CIP 104789 / BI429) TaxID=391009 RepID=A6LM19_THEM4|nr:hypothetical protein Tmel_1115 [Thermosipho melanesiensis BI429]